MIEEVSHCYTVFKMSS